MTPDPVGALLWFLVVAAVVAVAAWPRIGIFARIGRWRRLSERVRIEDALKHLLNCELDGTRGTAVSLAGILEVAPAKAHDLAERLGRLGLARFHDGGIELTDRGRVYALRILRTHRLLERYFADRTGAAPADWHALAETAEHGLSEDEVEALSSRMGNPVYDPHGDPIPTAAGDLPPRRGIPLTDLEPGEAATVIHVEDEPAAVYDRLLAAGIDRAVPVKMLSSADPAAIEVLVGGAARRLDPMAAAGVLVDRVAEAAGHTVLFERLDVLRTGERARVVQIAPTVQGPQRRRLLDLGILPGTEIEAEIRSPSGDPMAFRIRGALIALRQAQASGIYIQRIPAEEPVGAAR